MKRFLVFFLLLLTVFVTNSCIGCGDKVYICTGGSSKRYHDDRDCRGLGNCSGAIRSVSLDEAEGMGRTPCRICY